MKLASKIKEKLNTTQILFLENFFLSCPENMASCIYLKSFSANQILINTDDFCSNVYILLKGRLQAIEEHISDKDFRFLDLNAIDLVGDYELFAQRPARLVTLITLEPSLCLVIPASDYLHWIKYDAHTLYIRLQMLMCQLIAQTQSERKEYFMDNKTRLLHIFYNEYIKAAPASEITILKTRNMLASHIGCSVRTVNRIIGSLKLEHCISLKHGKIHISAQFFNEKQHNSLNALNVYCSKSD